jgi:prephenate dehydrogenase
MVEPPFGGKPLFGIIGGTGRMGLWFRKFLEAQGLTVEVASRRTPLTPAELAAKADVLVLSVPIAAVVQLAAELGPKVREGGLLMDLTSLKSASVAAMLEASQCEVIGAHPLFGPDTPSVSGHTVVLCPARGKTWLPYIRGLLEGAGARVVISKPARHDRAMAAVQGLTHFDTLAFALALARLKLPLAELLEFATPNFKLKLKQAARILRQDPILYAQIEANNPEVPSALYTLTRAQAELREAALSGNIEAFGALFHEAAEFFAGLSEADYRDLTRQFIEACQAEESDE